MLAQTIRLFWTILNGTAGVALGGLLGAVRAMGKPMEDLVKQKIVVVGAGSGCLPFSLQFIFSSPNYEFVA